MAINSEWYRIFLHAAESSNLTRAAQSLHMTQPSVSYAIKQLEEELGVRLFDRLPKGVRLTHEGEELLRHVRQAFAELEAAERSMKKRLRLNEGMLRVGANGAIIKHFLLPILDTYHERNPGIRIQLSQERTRLILDRLKKGALDIGCVYLPVADEEIEIVGSQISLYCAVVGQAFADWSQEVLSAEKLARLPLLMLSPGSSTRSFIEEWFQMQGVDAEADFELNSLDMLAEFTERGYGVSFLPRAYVEPQLKDGTLVELRTEIPLPDRQIGVATRKHSTPSMAAKSFLELLIH
ncbi:LysR substrate-binding domain-containing protein [Paenibacillus pasadenensis]|uniref:LysR family transcriptional regulator n=1 Tax=Paenibacillus pasadenensis TaxID=217090 RepID=UPI00203E8C16|nr:LysR substrate-binding domain-containing protein [Paenibacillus pasadenensis]MCM3746936.1 LysR substrate-binding domain-containing protein [Paenibacillus pasadenensis]